MADSSLTKTPASALAKFAADTAPLPPGSRMYEDVLALGVEIDRQLASLHRRVTRLERPEHCPTCGCRMLDDAEHGWSCPTCTGADD